MAQRWSWLAGLMVACGAPSSVWAQLAPPPGWRWIPGRPDTASPMVQMPPGWHITTRSATLMHDPAVQASGRYALESEVFLFPGTSNEGYGLFLGGRDLGETDAAYLAFLMRRDGHVAVELHRAGATSAAVPWTFAPVIRRVTGDSAARNAIRISVERDSLFFEVNTTRVVSLARGDLPADGHFGFRAGADLSIHVTTLDVTRRLAPVPRR
jgi:hypothetical protein